MKPDHISSAEWDQAMGIARQACARVFRDGGDPVDAFATFGLSRDRLPVHLSETDDWSKAVEHIAYALCCRQHRAAA